MANRGRATFAKRQREIQRQERAREKSAKRLEREAVKIKLDRKNQVDPDIADIVPGPQPRIYDLPDELEQGATEAEDDAEDEAKDSGR